MKKIMEHKVAAERIASGATDEKECELQEIGLMAKSRDHGHSARLRLYSTSLEWLLLLH